MRLTSPNAIPPYGVFDTTHLITGISRSCRSRQLIARMRFVEERSAFRNMRRPTTCLQNLTGVLGKAVDYRVEAFEGLLLDRSTLGDAFGASGSCQCLLVILIVVSALTVVSAGLGALSGGTIATGVTVVLAAGSI
jgi:hypothetical protein